MRGGRKSMAGLPRDQDDLAAVMGVVRDEVGDDVAEVEERLRQT